MLGERTRHALTQPAAGCARRARTARDRLRSDLRGGPRGLEAAEAAAAEASELKKEAEAIVKKNAEEAKKVKK